MSIKSKKENLIKNIKSIDDKIQKLELQKKLYQLTLDKLEERIEEGQSEDQSSRS